jgi:hypothetical protein
VPGSDSTPSIRLNMNANAPESNDDQALLLADGMEILVGVLGNVLSGLGEEKH